ncbi:MAG: ergothioneine biosynthesis protein EgtB [Gemmatimonadota bacterium]|nr:ergothioneine biosynthesis protein EgtB [Gemmatimonadota bacterium]
MTAAAFSQEQDQIAALLAEARTRTLLLVEPLSDEDLSRQHDPLMSPILWDIGHIAHFELLWLVENTQGPVQFSEMPGMYNPFENPRAIRDKLKLMQLPELLGFMEQVRARVLDRLATVDLHGNDPLLRDGYVYHMVAQHEYQHNETILQTLQLKKGEPYHPAQRVSVPEPTIRPAGMVRFSGGEVQIGTDDRSAAYDNERPRHTVRLDPFWIDAAPVSNGEYLEFMQAGGYTTRELWSDAGWAWLQEARVDTPKHWDTEGGGWSTRSIDRMGPVDLHHPVCHVCYHEAEAYARWLQKRLPTEPEWEAACTWDPETGTRSEFPWGNEAPTPEHANLDQLTWGTAPIGAYPRNVSPMGCYGMIGDVWEWTSSDLGPYPGYQTFPYKEYSEAFFGTEYKVLRGGSWATRPGAIRSTFRNWDYPIRRQIFSGFRCARHA